MVGTADLNWPERYSIPQSIMLHVQTGGSCLGKADHCLGDGLGIDQRVVNNCIVLSLCFLGFIPLSLFPVVVIISLIIQLLNCSYLSAWAFPFSSSFPHPTVASEVSKQLWYLVTVWC